MRPLAATILLIALVGCGGKTPAKGDPLAACAKSGLCGNGPLFAVTTLAFVGADMQKHSKGFHLPGADTGACPSSGLTDATTNAVVDNQVANLLPIVEGQIGSALPTLVQNAINGGGLSLLFEVVGDPTTDKTVDLVVHGATGTPLLGADGLLLADQTLALKPGPPLGVCRNATVSGSAITCGPFDLSMGITVFQNTYPLTFLDSYMILTIPTDGSDASALMGGTVSIQNIQDIATEAGPAAGSGLEPVVMNVLPSLADVPDPKTQVCDRISGSMAMTGRAVFAIPQ